MYTKVPAARLEKMISYMSPALATSIPRPTPMGVAIAKMKIKLRHSFISSGNVLTSEIPREHPAAPLCTRMAITILMS